MANRSVAFIGLRFEENLNWTLEFEFHGVTILSLEFVQIESIICIDVTRQEINPIV